MRIRLHFFNARCDTNHDDTLPDEKSQQELPFPEEELKLEETPQHHLEEVLPHSPVQLFKGDPDISSEEQASIQKLEELNVKWEMPKGQLKTNDLMIEEISRHNCVNELLTLYQKETTVNRELLLSMKDEDAAGEGVHREVFLDSFVSSNCKRMLPLHFLRLCSLITNMTLLL